MGYIEEFLKKRGNDGLLRTLNTIVERKNGIIHSEGREYIDFSSNDYLGLANHPELIEEAKKTLVDFGTAVCASRLMSGNLKLHRKLEERIARFKNKEAALVFNSGYHANTGIISALFGKGDCIFSDRLNHSSIIDGISLSGAKVLRFRHNSVEHLEELLKRERAGFRKALIITETVFSMDGDKSPLTELVVLKEKYDCVMMVDEAHATGIFGESGAGIVQENGLEGKIDLIMGTFSKALAGFGAYLCASKSVIDYLINTCRSFIYSTALPPAIIAVNIKSIELIEKEPFRREKLLYNAENFRKELKGKGFCIGGCSQIVPLIVAENFKALEYSRRLKQKGYWVLPIRPPTVPLNQARLRFSLSYNHNRDILERLVEVISEINGNRA